jgi:DNA-binding beta-propeller fold protein YncE
MQGEEKMRTLRGLLLTTLACLLLASAAPDAEASRTLLSETALETAALPSEGQIEGPCGLAVSPGGTVYLADYYHRTIDRFTMPTASTRGAYTSRIVLPGANPVFGVNTLDSVCGLAFDAAGELYGNEWHQGVVRLTGGEAVIDSGESTGIAIDPSTNRLYVDDRTRILEYALPFTAGDEPVATIGTGHLGDGYGLATFEGRVYVADASSDKVRVFEPATNPDLPAANITAPFVSLTDAALAIDPGNGHLLVVDNRQPSFEHPKSAVLEFGSAASGYPFLGTLPGAPIAGGPSGIAALPDGKLLVTDGNSELSNAFLYGPFEESASAASLLRSPSAQPGTATADGASSGGGDESAGDVLRTGPSASASEVVQSGGVRARFQGNLSPTRLPRQGRAPVRASVGVRISSGDGRRPPQLRKIEIAINRNGHFSPTSMPACHIDEIQPATTTEALAACRRSLVGEGTFSARVLLPQQAPFPSTGKVFAFNARWHGRPAILAHVYGTEPLPISYTLPFALVPQHGTFGTLLRASLPSVTANSAYITSLTLTLGRGGYLTAGCPAPAGLNGAIFPFARADLTFAGGRRIGQTLTRTCRAHG